jgi:hypothetical protein
LRADGLGLTVHRFWNSYGQVKVSVLGPVLLALLAGLLLAACGSGTRTGSGTGETARTLLKQTFSGSHPITSGKLNASVALDPAGSSVLTGPVTLSFGGPFQSRGTGKLPKSDFTVGVSYASHAGSLGIISTGTAGFVTLAGTAYRLPAADFQQLERGVSGVGGGASASTTSTLARLGIHPEQWLTDPEVVGTAMVGGARTEHIHGTLALGPLLADLSLLLAKASTVSSSTSGLKSISPAEQTKLRSEITHASFDLWTGISDHTIRKLAVTATLPVSGTLSQELGGLRTATVSFALGYSDVGQTQSIGTPASSQPYAKFEAQLKTVILGVEQAVVADAASSGGPAGSTATTATGSTAYYACVDAAGGSAAKIKKCAAKLTG